MFSRRPQPYGLPPSGVSGFGASAPYTVHDLAYSARSFIGLSRTAYWHPTCALHKINMYGYCWPAATLVASVSANNVHTTTPSVLRKSHCPSRVCLSLAVDFAQRLSTKLSKLTFHRPEVRICIAHACTVGHTVPSTSSTLKSLQQRLNAVLAQRRDMYLKQEYKFTTLQCRI
jgi:hypothetical protein